MEIKSLDIKVVRIDFTAKFSVRIEVPRGEVEEASDLSPEQIQEAFSALDGLCPDWQIDEGELFECKNLWED